MSIKSIKEKQLLVNFAKSLGQEVDQSIIDDLNEHNNFEKNLKLSIKSNLINDLNNAVNLIKENNNNYSFTSALDELQESTKSNGKPTIAEKTLIDLTADFLKVNENSYNQPNPSLVSSSTDAIQQKIKFLEQWIGKIALLGPGGGAGSEAKLDRETKLVNSSVYNITTRDFYIGVNFSGSVTLNLPSIVKNGTMYIIKDESGNCSLNPITVIGNIDNDAGGLILQQNNGGIQMIYRNGWRII